jgi:hypothetical protein
MSRLSDKIETGLDDFFSFLEDDRFYGADETPPSVIKDELNKYFAGFGDTWEDWWLEGDEEWT